MKAAAAALLAALLTAPPAPAAAETVFRCDENGKTIFTQNPSGASCQPLELKVIEPDPEEAARQRRESELWNEERERLVQQSRDREAKAAAQKRQAELKALTAETGRRGKARAGRSRRGRAGQSDWDNPPPVRGKAPETPRAAPDPMGVAK
jgi:hypothetical protein